MYHTRLYISGQIQNIYVFFSSLMLYVFWSICLKTLKTRRQIRAFGNSDSSILRYCWCVLIHHLFCWTYSTSWKQNIEGVLVHSYDIYLCRYLEILQKVICHVIVQYLYTFIVSTSSSNPSMTSLAGKILMYWTNSSSGIKPDVEYVFIYSRKDDEKSLEPLCFDFEMHWLHSFQNQPIRH